MKGAGSAESKGRTLPTGIFAHPGGVCYSPRMARPRRIYKLKWRSKKANHGRKPTRGRDKKWH